MEKRNKDDFGKNERAFNKLSDKEIIQKYAEIKNNSELQEVIQELSIDNK